ncbi:FAD-dependent monooxygenase [Mycetocola sp.]|uniref:FAD-dependent monooxygenase n=1 Tax=Mycetocola sp. TaxID=1871042 RepID=UPI003989F672
MSERTALIVGGGIGGLSAALALRRVGYRVTVIEQARQLTEVGAGIGMNPNAVGALTALGLHDRLQATVVQPRWSIRRRWEDGSELIRVDLEAARERFSYPFWFMHRGDLQTALVDAAVDSSGLGTPVVIKVGVRMTGFDPDRRVVTTEASGEFSADVIIGADGIASRTRAELFYGGDPEYSGQTIYRSQIPLESLSGDAELEKLASGSNFETWLGPGGHIVHCTFRSGTVFNFTGSFDAPAIGGGVRTAAASREALAAHIEGWYPALHRILDRAPSLYRYDLYLIPALERWTESNLALIGDAAHPMMPYLGQGAAQAIEDAECLAAALDGVPVEGIPEALRAYESVRRPRATKVQSVSQGNGRIFHLPDGPEQRERDAAIARGASDWDITAWLWEYQSPATTMAR